MGAVLLIQQIMTSSCFCLDTLLNSIVASQISCLNGWVVACEDARGGVLLDRRAASVRKVKIFKVAVC